MDLSLVDPGPDFRGRGADPRTRAHVLAPGVGLSRVDREPALARLPQRPSLRVWVAVKEPR